MINKKSYIPDRYKLCIYADGMAHMNKIFYDDLQSALREGERRFTSSIKYTYLHLYDNWNQRIIKDWTGWALHN